MIDQKAIEYAIKRARESIEWAEYKPHTDTRIPLWDIVEEIAEKWNVDNETALDVATAAWKKVTAEGFGWEDDPHHGWEGDDMIQGDLFKEQLKNKLRPIIKEALSRRYK